MKQDEIRILHTVAGLGGTSGAIRTLSVLSAGGISRGQQLSAAFYTRTAGESASTLRCLGARVVNLGWGQERLSRLQRIKLVFRLSMFIISNKIDVVHAHNWDADLYASLSIGLRPVKKIVTIHSLSYINWMKQHASRYRSVIVPRIDHFVCVSRDLQQVLSECRIIPDNKISVIYNSSSSEFLMPRNEQNRQEARAEFQVSENEILIGTVGNLTPVKGIEYLLEALAQVKSKQVKLILIGAYEEDPQNTYARFLQEPAIASRIIFAGYRSDIPRLLDAIDIFILSSIVEADPWAVTEAMAKAKPIIATRVGGVPEKIQDGKTGFLVSPRDSHALAAKINYCLENPSVAGQMGLDAKRFIESNFSSEEMVNKYIALYK